MAQQSSIYFFIGSNFILNYCARAVLLKWLELVSSSTTVIVAAIDAG